MTTKRPDFRWTGGPFRNGPRAWWFFVGCVVGGVAWSNDADMPSWVWALIALPFSVITFWRDHRDREARKLRGMLDSTFEALRFNRLCPEHEHCPVTCRSRQ